MGRRGRKEGRQGNNNYDAGLALQKEKEEEERGVGEGERKKKKEKNDYQRIKQSLWHTVEVLIVFGALSMGTLRTG